MKKILLPLCIIVVLALGFYLVKNSSHKNLTVSQKAEAFLLAQTEKTEPHKPIDQIGPACSFFLYGNDEKYIYGYGSCQTLDMEYYIDENNFSKGGGEPGDYTIGGGITGPIRLSYVDNFNITGYEETCPSSSCYPQAKDLIPMPFFTQVQSNEYIAVQKENLSKLLSGQKLNRGLAKMLAVKGDYDDQVTRHLGWWPNGKSETTEDSKGWSVALYMNSSDPDINITYEDSQNVAAECYQVMNDFSTKKAGEYIPPKGKKAVNIDPLSCLPKEF